jgi:hypothetical protein
MKPMLIGIRPATTHMTSMSVRPLNGAPVAFELRPLPAV